MAALQTNIEVLYLCVTKVLQMSIYKDKCMKNTSWKSNNFSMHNVIKVTIICAVMVANTSDFKRFVIMI